MTLRCDRPQSSLATALLMFLAAACFNPSYDAPRCGPDQACPSGLTCVGEVCVRNPMADLDAPTGNDAPVADAPPTVVTLPSCMGLAKTCGPNGNGDCCESPLVPGGTYFRAYDVGPGGGGQTYAATVSSFRLDKYEVTVGRYRAFATANRGTQANPPADGSGAHARIPGSGWSNEFNSNLPDNQTEHLNAISCSSALQTWRTTPGDTENRPMNCLNWYDAMAFCIWDGGYLPSEAEWNYAAAGGDQHRARAWADPPDSLTISPAHASYGEGSTCLGDGQPACTVEDFIRVGTKPMGNGRWGHSELAGNVFEWVLDTVVGFPVPCDDCAQLSNPASGQILRGGDYSMSAGLLRPGIRSSTGRIGRSPSFGVRCARPVAQ
jgi:formylglycine-generating enzyme